jgi:rubrerythrin
MSGGEGFSRGEIILKGALGAGAILGLGAVGPTVRRALATSSSAELDALDLALTFEHLELDFYTRAPQRLKHNEEVTPELRNLIETLTGDERQHREALVAQIEGLGGTPAAKGSYAFAYFPEPYEFLRMAEILELAGIAAYNGAIPAIESEDARRLTTSIVQVEGRHAAAVQMQRGEEPAPAAFDRGTTEFQARSSVEKFTGEY